MVQLRGGASHVIVISERFADIYRNDRCVSAARVRASFPTGRKAI